MRSILAAVRAALANVWKSVTRIVDVVRNVGGKMVRTLEPVTELVRDVAAGAVSAVDTVASAPFRLLRALTGGGRQPGEAEAAQSAEKAAEAEQAAADRQDDTRTLMTTLRRVALARAAGKSPDAELLSRLPNRLATYVMSLSAEECEALGRTTTSKLRDIVHSGATAPGFRSPAVAADDVGRAARRKPRTDDDLTAKAQAIAAEINARASTAA